MSNIYEKITGDKTLVLTARDGFMRKFNFGNWTDMAIGMYFTGIVGDNSAVTTQEDATIVTNSDKITFGIKNSSNTTLPGFSGSYFVGASTGTADAAANAFNTSYGNSSGRLYATGTNGTSSIGGTTNYGLNNLGFPSGGGTGATTYNGFHGVRFIIANLGTNTQTILVKFGRTDSIAGTNYSSDALVTQMIGQTWTGPFAGDGYTIAWNDGASAYPIPDAFWIRLPFYTNIMRMSSIAAVKFT